MKISEYENVLKPNNRTLCFLLDGDKVLLGLKKKGFGQGKWLGIGGKVEEGESVEEAAKREVKEEIGVTLRDMEKIARSISIFRISLIIGTSRFLCFLLNLGKGR